MNSVRSFLLVGLLSMLVTTACGSSESPLTFASLPASGNAEAGKALFAQGTRKTQSCGSCHSVDAKTEVGPSLKGIATRAGTRVEGEAAENYLFDSIVSPNKYIVSGFSTGLMPTSFGTEYSPQQIRDLITYLMTLK